PRLARARRQRRDRMDLLRDPRHLCDRDRPHRGANVGQRGACRGGSLGRSVTHRGPLPRLVRLSRPPAHGTACAAQGLHPSRHRGGMARAAAWRDPGTRQRRARRLRAAGLLSFVPATDPQRIVYTEALRTYNQLLEERRERLEAVEYAVPGELWGVVIAGAIISLAASWVFRLESLALHGLMTGLLAAMIG